MEFMLLSDLLENALVKNKTSKVDAPSFHLGRPIVRVLSRNQSVQHTESTAGHSSTVAKQTQKLDEHFTKAVRRFTRAIDGGVAHYIERRDQRSLEEKDGALVGAVENMAQGVSLVISESAPALTDLAGLVTLVPLTEQIRQAAKALN